MPGPPNYIRYVPAQDGAQPKIIQMVEVQKDPLEPPRFKINQKVPRAPPSPPVPVMHSPPRKITAEEHKQWKIPPCVSNWKNPRGYTVPLDKRCAFNGRAGAEPETVNPKFAQLSETLYISTKQHRAALEEKMKAEKLMAQKEKEKHEEGLRLLAQQAREQRAAMQRGLGHNRNDESDDDDRDDVDNEELNERRRLRDERHRERVRNVNIKSSNPERRTKLDRQRERDISEKVALGMARPNTDDNDVHDQRLYNQSQGLGSGFDDDEDYTVYDKAWKSKDSFSKTYRPSDNLKQDLKEREIDENPSKARTSDPNNDPLAPIQFEKDDVEQIFNVESFLRNAKYNARKLQESSSSSSSKRHKS
jgi:SNW domain-containing protein 1